MVSGCVLLQVLSQLHELLVSIIIDLSYSETNFDKCFGFHLVLIVPRKSYRIQFLSPFNIPDSYIIT